MEPSGPGNSLRRVVLAWDLYAALAVTLVTALVFFWSDRSPRDWTAALIASIPFGLAVVVAAVTALRWVGDRVNDSRYGELLRLRDHDESIARSPFLVVMVAGGATSVVGLTGLLVTNGPRWLTALLLAALAGLVIYDLLATFMLYRIAALHQRYLAATRSIEEDFMRQMREIERERDTDNDTGST